MKEFIADNFLGHAAEYPDPNEQVEPLRAYLESTELLHAGRIDEAIALLEDAVAKYPESRHAHAGLGYALYARYEKTQSKDDMQAFVGKLLDADQIGFTYGRVHYTTLVALGLGRLGDKERLDVYFEQAIKVAKREYLSTLDYARGLALIDDPNAEEWFKKAMSIEPTGIADSVAYYADWLLEHGANESVINLINEEVQLNYAHFLKGVALERTGELLKAEKEYEKYREMSIHFPAPVKYRIQDSKPQSVVLFEGDVPSTNNTEPDPDDVPGTDGEQVDAKKLVAKVVQQEAGNESIGARRAVAWAIRTRVFRAYSVSSACGGYNATNNGRWNALPSDSKRAAKYKNICNAPGQFSQFAGEPSFSNQQIADQVWRGIAPDPIVVACIGGGSIIGGQCAGTCPVEKPKGAFPTGAPYFQFVNPTSSPCCRCHRFAEQTCMTYQSGCQCSCMQCGGIKPCYNGNNGVDSENCFYRLL